MARFDQNAYETVDQRIRRFYNDNPTGRITTELVSATGDPGSTRWVVKANVWRDRVDGDPDGTGYAFELDGAGMANKTSALENCETSAVGRALAQAGYSGDLRATREEMAKVAAAQPAAPYKPSRDWIGDMREAVAAGADRDKKNEIYAGAVADGAHSEYLDSVREAGRG